MEIIKPEERYIGQYLEACRESIVNDIKEWMPVQLDHFDSWKASAMQTYEMLESGNGLPAGYPRTVTYWCVEEGRFVGEIQIRPYLSEEEAMKIGHIGYAVRYSMWNKGIGTKLLSFAAEELRRRHVAPIYIACHADNLGSNRVSRKVGFEFIETRTEGEEKENLYILR